MSDTRDEEQHAQSSDQPEQSGRRVVESPRDEEKGQTVNPEYADDDEGQYASWQDVTRQRDEEGNLLPRDVYVEEFDSLNIDPPYALAIPFHGDQRQRYLVDPSDPDVDKEEVTDAELAELFDKNLVEPDLTEHPACRGGRVTEQLVAEEIDQPMQDACFVAVMLASNEYEYVRRMRRLERGELTDAEIKMALEERERREEEGPQPQGNRSRNQTRRDRRR